MPRRRRDEVPVPIHSTMVQGIEEQELLELQEHVVMEEEMGKEGEVLAGVGERRRRQGDYEESEGRREDKEEMEDSGPGLGNSLLGPGHWM